MCSTIFDEFLYLVAPRLHLLQLRNRDLVDAKPFDEGRHLGQYRAATSGHSQQKHIALFKAEHTGNLRDIHHGLMEQDQGQIFLFCRVHNLKLVLNVLFLHLCIFHFTVRAV